MHTPNERVASGKATLVVKSVKSTANNTNTESEHQGETASSAVMGSALARPRAPWLVYQRDDGLLSIGWHDDVPGPFDTHGFAAAVAGRRRAVSASPSPDAATAAPAAKGTRP
jgi:hypothetical protein